MQSSFLIIINQTDHINNWECPPLTSPGWRNFPGQSIEEKHLVLQKGSIYCREIWSQRRWVMDELASYCFHLYSSKGMLDLRSIRGNYDTIFILRGVAPSRWPSVIIRRVIWMPPRWCPLIWVSDQCWSRRLLRMRENFGLRESFHGYPLKEVLIKTIGYRLLMVHIVLLLAYSQGRSFDCLVSF